MSEHDRVSTEIGASQNVDPKNDFEKVKLLFDYTKYHIGIYTTLGTILVGALGLHDNITLKFCGLLLWLSIAFIGVAGLAGGIIASTLPESDSLTDFFRQKTGPWGRPLLSLSGRRWTMVEHTAFWAGLIIGVTSFAFAELFPHFTQCYCALHIS